MKAGWNRLSRENQITLGVVVGITLLLMLLAAVGREASYSACMKEQKKAKVEHSKAVEECDKRTRFFDL